MGAALASSFAWAHCLSALNDLSVCAERSCIRMFGELIVRNPHCAGTNHTGHFVLATSLLEKMTAQAQVTPKPHTMLPQLQCVSSVTTAVCRVC